MTTKTLEARVTALEEDQSVLREQTEATARAAASAERKADRLSTELRTRGLPVPEYEGNPKPKLSDESYQDVRRRNAAVARSKKGVGEGSGQVKDAKTRKKLQDDAAAAKRGAARRRRGRSL